jgi:hypothetical protein
MRAALEQTIRSSNQVLNYRNLSCPNAMLCPTTALCPCGPVPSIQQLHSKCPRAGAGWYVAFRGAPRCPQSTGLGFLRLGPPARRSYQLLLLLAGGSAWALSNLSNVCKLVPLRASAIPHTRTRLSIREFFLSLVHSVRAPIQDARGARPGGRSANPGQ